MQKPRGATALIQHKSRRVYNGLGTHTFNFIYIEPETRLFYGQLTQTKEKTDKLPTAGIAVLPWGFAG